MFNEFIDFFQTGQIEMKNNRFNRILREFAFYFTSNENKCDSKIIQQKVKNNFIVIDIYDGKKTKKVDTDYFIICFNQIVIFGEVNDFHQVIQLFQNNKNATIYCCSNENSNIICDLFKKYDLKNNYVIEIPDENFLTEISSFLSFFLINVDKNQEGKCQIEHIWLIIRRCISAYLIKKSYINSQFDRVLNFSDLFDSSEQLIFISENNFISLRSIGYGNISTLNLIYYIEKEQLCVLKTFIPKYLDQTKLYQRELQNYQKIHHPFICKCICRTRFNNYDALIIEFIEGVTLKDLNLPYIEKIKIAFEIMIVLEYLHQNNFIYRDLKPNNLIVNPNKTIVLIDFDEMIDNKINTDEINHTTSFSHQYIAPEIVDGKKFSFSCDIYSFGKILLHIFKEELKEKINIQEYKKLKEIIDICIQKNPDKRPNIKELINIFYIDFVSNISMNILEKNVFQTKNTSIYNSKYLVFISEYTHPFSLYNLGKIYEEGIIFYKDINKAIHYYSLAAEHNFAEAQNRLGLIFYKDLYHKNVNKAIYYITLAAKQNNQEAILNLAYIYYEESIISKNYEKSIFYFTILANKNNCEAQFMLGVIYSKLTQTPENIKKVIYYYSQSANQNHADALYKIGMIYLEGKIVSRDINKAIDSLLKSSNQGNANAQFNLGLLYHNGQYVQKDIMKAIHYYTLASLKNHRDANFNLSLVFDAGGDIPRDIDKALYYLKLAASQKIKKAQYNLALNYIYGTYGVVDLDKALYYSKLGADQNDAKCQFLFGSLLLYANPRRRDVNKSIYYLQLASKQNHPVARYFLGIIYSNGIFVPRDFNKAFYYLKMSADQNNAFAQCHVGVLYLKGEGVKRDFEKAIYYINLAAKQNHSEAYYLLGSMHFNGDYYKKDPTKAIYYFALAASMNHLLALSYLGIFYTYGIYVKQDIHKAIYYYTIAANMNDIDAQYSLGIIYFSGMYISRDINKSIQYLSLSANRNHKMSEFLLATIFISGEYIHQDIEMAIRYYKMASSLNCQYSKNNLGIIYKNGIGVKKNIQYAVELLNESKNIDSNEISSFNLALIYLYNKIDINLSIKLLVELLLFRNFLPAIIILCIALIKKYKIITLDIIKNELKSDNNGKIGSKYSEEIYNKIISKKLNQNYIFQIYFESYRYIDYFYKYDKEPILTSNFIRFENKINSLKQQKFENKYNLTKDFYDGLGLDVNGMFNE